MNGKLICMAAISMAALWAGPAKADRTPWTHLNYQNNPDDFQFAIVPDRTGGDYRGGFTNALAKVNMMHPEFVITVGDLVEGMTMPDINARRRVEDIKRAQQVELTNITAKVIPPFFTVVGNHDISRSRTAHPGSSRANETSTAMWKEFYGENTYYSFMYKNVLFVCLNTMDGRHGPDAQQCGISGEQYAWFRKTLDEHADARWTIVFMHQPSEWLTEAWFKLETEVLTKRNYTVFAGDWHAYMHAKRHGRDYYVLSVAGGGSCHNEYGSEDRRAALMGKEYGEMDHITWVTMTPHGPDVVNLMLDGMLPGDYLSQRTTRNVKYTNPIDYPVDAATEARLAKVRAENAAATPSKVVNASSFGWDKDDATAALQAAIDSGADRVVVDWISKGAGVWTVGPIALRSSNQQIWLRDGVTVRAKPGSLAAPGASLFTVPDGVENVSLRGSGFAAFDVSGESSGSGSPCAAVAVGAARNVHIHDIALDTGDGEGVRVASGAKDVWLDYVLCRGRNIRWVNAANAGSLRMSDCRFEKVGK